MHTTSSLLALGLYLHLSQFIRRFSIFWLDDTQPKCSSQLLIILVSSSEYRQTSKKEAAEKNLQKLTNLFINAIIVAAAAAAQLAVFVFPLFALKLAC